MKNTLQHIEIPSLDWSPFPIESYRARLNEREAHAGMVLTGEDRTETNPKDHRQEHLKSKASKS
jgi:hypothetical protein